MRKSLKLAGTVSPFGLNQKISDNEDDQRRVSWNDPVEIKRRESNPKNSGSIDPLILDIEEKPLLAIRVGIIPVSIETPVDVFGKNPCPECQKVKRIESDGCQCVVAITSANRMKDVYSLLEKKRRPRIKFS
jgi:hypothetical protein